MLCRKFIEERGSTLATVASKHFQMLGLIRKVNKYYPNQIAQLDYLHTRSRTVKIYEFGSLYEKLWEPLKWSIRGSVKFLNEGLSGSFSSLQCIEREIEDLEHLQFSKYLVKSEELNTVGNTIYKGNWDKTIGLTFLSKHLARMFCL